MQRRSKEHVHHSLAKEWKKYQFFFYIFLFVCCCHFASQIIIIFYQYHSLNVLLSIKYINFTIFRFVLVQTNFGTIYYGDNSSIFLWFFDGWIISAFVYRFFFLKYFFVWIKELSSGNWVQFSSAKWKFKWLAISSSMK